MQVANIYSWFSIMCLKDDKMTNILASTSITITLFLPLQMLRHFEVFFEDSDWLSVFYSFKS